MVKNCAITKFDIWKLSVIDNNHIWTLKLMKDCIGSVKVISKNCNCSHLFFYTQEKPTDTKLLYLYPYVYQVKKSNLKISKLELLFMPLKHYVNME